MLYGYNKKPTGRIARARISRVNCSFKDLCEVCRNVRGKDTGFALDFLGNAAEGKQAIYFARHNKKKGHRRELGGKKGGFPVKSCRAVLGVVESADANAMKLGLGATKIVHIAANKHATYPRMSPKGRRIRHDYEVAFIEVVLEEKQEKLGAKKAETAPKKNDVPKAAVTADVKAAVKADAKAAVPAAKVEAAPKKAAAAPQKSN
ncbi:MAG: 50S ribosomal protein L22 [Candidatus Micrarchaeia archaeon]|jgi:large subunit ribosomal protein L22